MANQCIRFERDVQNITAILFLNYLDIFVDSIVPIVPCCCPYLKNILVFFFIKWWSHTERASEMRLLLRSYSFHNFGIEFINWIQKYLTRLFARFSLKSCPTWLIPWFARLLLHKDLLSILMCLLNQITCEVIVDGILDNIDRLLLHFLKISW